MIAHSTVRDVATQAARAYGLPLERIILMDTPGNVPESNLNSLPPYGAVPDLITTGLNIPRCFVEQSFQRGEAKAKVALLAWSSGTTGNPKVSILPSGGMFEWDYIIVFPHRPLRYLITD
jgi:4-coumarate--CoA ligase